MYLMSTRHEAIRAAYRGLFDEGWARAHAVAREQQPTLPPWWEAPATARQRFEQDFAKRNLNADPRDPRTRSRLLPAFAAGAPDVVLDTYRDFHQGLASLPADEAKRLLRVRIPRARGRRLAPKAHADNLELAWYVVERIIPFEQLLQGRLKPGRHGPRNGAPWNDLAEEWNLTHPRKQKTSATLRHEYYHAIGRMVKNKRTGKRRYYLTPLASDLLSQLREELDGRDWFLGGQSWEQLAAGWPEPGPDTDDGLAAKGSAASPSSAQSWPPSVTWDSDTWRRYVRWVHDDSAGLTGDVLAMFEAEERSRPTGAQRVIIRHLLSLVPPGGKSDAPLRDWTPGATPDTPRQSSRTSRPSR